MPETPWFKEFPGAITICDAEGIILDMNDKAAKDFELSKSPSRCPTSFVSDNRPSSSVLRLSSFILSLRSLA